MNPKYLAIFCSSVIFAGASFADSSGKEQKSSDLENNEAVKKIKDIYFRDQKGELLEDIIDKEMEKKRKEWVKEKIEKKKARKKGKTLNSKKQEKSFSKDKEKTGNASTEKSEKRKNYISRLEKWKKEKDKQASEKE